MIKKKRDERVKDGQCVRSFSGHSDGLNFVSWASFSLLTASVDRTARLWAEEPRIFQHPNEVNSALEHQARKRNLCRSLLINSYSKSHLFLLLFLFLLSFSL